MSTLARFALVSMAVALVMAPLGARPRGFDYVARVWPTSGVFPEAERDEKPADVAVAFSGGGTRSAAASLGQLRGLRDNGWLSKIGYISAVSGGSWAAVPFSFSDRNADDRLLGPQPPFADLTVERLRTTPARSLAHAISRSRLILCGTGEALRIAGLLSRDLWRAITQIPGRCRYGDVDAGTYGRLLGSIFLRETTSLDSTGLTAWDVRHLDEILAVNPNLTAAQFNLAAAGRPFLIVNATVMRERPGEYELLPIEMTPYYTGVRPYRDAVGGSYIWSWALDSLEAAALYPDQPYVRVIAGNGHRGLTPEDMMAASGAAPLLEVVKRLPPKAAGRIAAYFPHFTHVTVRNGRFEPPQVKLLHGDGGFLDNDGLMPLLARQVRNVLVFVNTRSSLADNGDLAPYFRRPAGPGPKVDNVVFEDHYDEVKNGLEKKISEGRGAVYCGTDWKVRANRTYGIEPYEHLNICFVYNYHSHGWWTQLPPATRAQVPRSYAAVLTGAMEPPRGVDKFIDFPWYQTFFENTPSVIHLEESQVNLLAHMASWTLADQKTYIESYLQALK